MTRGEHEPFLASNGSAQGVDLSDEPTLGWLEWGVRLANDLHRAPQNASRRQRRLVAALCSRLSADAGSTAVFVDASDRPRNGGGSDGATLRRIYFVAHEPAAPTTAIAVGQVSGMPGRASSNGTAADACRSDDALRLEATPSVCQVAVDDEWIARSFIALPDARASLLELRRRPNGKPADAFDPFSLAVMHAVHRACAWACDASSLTAGPVVPGLSPRERETLEHLLAGASEKQVATLLKRSPHTIHSYVKRIYRQLGVSSRAELLAIFVDASGRTADSAG